MNLKKARKISDILYMLTLGLVFMTLTLPQYRIALVVLVIVSLAVQMLFSMRFMVCPYCGHNVGRYDSVCPACKRALNTDRKVRKKDNK